MKGAKLVLMAAAILCLTLVVTAQGPQTGQAAQVQPQDPDRVDAAHQELLKADKKAGELYGRDEFVRALQKIHSMGFADVEELEKKKKRSMYDKPGVAERLENLSTFH